MALRKAVSTVLHEWGYGTVAGPRETVPLKLRGEIARRRYVTEGGDNLRLREDVEIVKRDGGQQRLTLGNNVLISEHARLVFEGPDGIIEIGDDVFINARSEVRSREQVRIGADTIVSYDVCILDTNSHSIVGIETTQPVTLGEHVWVGARATILPGVTVGSGAVIGAGSVVTRNVPERCLVAGNPVRVLREDITWTR